jgi:cell division protein FtsB
MGKLLNIWNFIGRHKYLITLGVFTVIIVFLDENSAIRRLKYKREIMQLNEEIEKYRAEYEESTEKLNELNSNPESLEKIAREKYLMKKPNEDIYVFQE